MGQEAREANSSHASRRRLGLSWTEPISFNPMDGALLRGFEAQGWLKGLKDAARRAATFAQKLKELSRKARGTTESHDVSCRSADQGEGEHGRTSLVVGGKTGDRPN